eukprot:gene2710-5335_t
MFRSKLHSLINLSILILTSSFRNLIGSNSRVSLSNLRLNGLLDMFNTGKSTEKIDASSLQLINNAPSWKDLDSLLRTTERREERDNFDNIKKGRGPANSKATIRLFDAPDDFKPEVTLYRDAAAWCPYCEKVWLQLEEKRIPYIVDKSSPLRCYGEKPQAFLRIQPNGMLPVAMIKGRLISESNVIMQALEDNFPNNNPLLPSAGNPQEPRVAGLLRLERQVFSIWFSWLTSSRDSSRSMDEVIREVDAELGKTSGPYFLGEKLSLVDVMFTPFLERMAASLPYYKGFTVRDNRYPNLLRWYEAMDSREAYRGIKSDYIGNCYSTASSGPFQTAIDGGVWDIATPASVCMEPMIPIDDGEARRDAARNILANHDAIVRFAGRGYGAKAGRPVNAPLADPYVTVSEDLLPNIDAALRHVCHAMLEGPEAVLTRGISVGVRGAEVDSCLSYLRERVGVPRDMSIHGARQLRAHINWLLTVKT